MELLWLEESKTPKAKTLSWEQSASAKKGKQVKKLMVSKKPKSVAAAEPLQYPHTKQQKTKQKNTKTNIKKKHIPKIKTWRGESLPCGHHIHEQSGHRSMEKWPKWKSMKWGSSVYGDWGIRGDANWDQSWEELSCRRENKSKTALFFVCVNEPTWIIDQSQSNQSQTRHG